MSKAEYKVHELVSMIQNKTLGLPEMQRSYVWEASRVRDLFDSLYRGYPSGVILAWEPGDADVATTTFAVGTDAGSTISHRLLLLDGQQRLTSLSAVMRGEPVEVRNRKRPISILFNLEHPDEMFSEDEDEDESRPDTDDDEQTELHSRFNKRTFIVASKQLESLPQWVKLTDIFSGRSELDIVREALLGNLNDPRADKYSERIRRVKAIRDYIYRVDILERTMSYEEVTEIFVRVNSLGAKLRSSDLALAQITSKWNGSLATFTDFQKEIDKLGFELDLAVYLRTLIALITDQARFKTVSSIRVEDLQSGWKRTVKAINFAINFLRSNLNVESPSLLSSPYIVTAIAYWIDKAKYDVSPEAAAAFEKWARIANAKSRYSGSSETALDQDLAAIRSENPSELLFQRLRQQFGRLSFAPDDLIGRSSRGGEFKTIFAMMRMQGARDWATQLAISAKHKGKTDQIEFHHIFPKAHLRRVRPDVHERIVDDIANLAFIGSSTNKIISDRSPSEYRKDFDEALLEIQNVLLNDGLDQAERFEEFLTLRRQMLAAQLNAYLQVSTGE
jgi:hypothetical protein